MNPIYLDYNATTPIDPLVAEAMIPYIKDHFGNPSSSHVFGVVARKAVEKARRQVAELLHCRIDELIFTGSGSESNNHAIIGIARAYRDKGNHIITSAVEHPAVTEVCRFLEKEGYRVTYLPVDGYGLVDPRQVEQAITPYTILITVMHANNEVGTIQPITEIASLGRSRGVIVHSDCAQSIGKTPVTVDELGVDLLSVAGHKLYAPKGVGALYIRSGVKLGKFIHGADHEMNLRAGTENVVEIVGLGEACRLISENLPRYCEQMKTMRDRLESGLKRLDSDLRINGHPQKRLPNTLSVSFRGMEANTILAELKEVAASAGAACHSDRVDISSVLKAMNVPTDYAMGTIRFSVGRFTTPGDIDQALEEIAAVIKRLRAGAGRTAVDSEPGQIKLTQFTHGLGCACKLRPQLLENILRRMPAANDRRILVGTDTSDDAAVYLINEQVAVVETVDFFTPIVDDPFQFGAVAAANSLSDIYAMGAKPLFALNVVGFPSHRLPVNVLDEILKGARSVADKAGVSIIGGHTVDDTEPKYGMVVTGVIAPDSVITNRSARPGDELILTKPIGTGILATALKQGMLEETLAEQLVRTMVTLNKTASEIMVEVKVNACTDVTGFGLLGHLMEMMTGSRATAIIDSEAVPLLPGAMEAAVAGIIPGGTKDNMDYTSPFIQYGEKVSPIMRLLLNDAQTSGGLLISVPALKAEIMLKRLREKGIDSAALIGKVVSEEDKRIKVE
jgi:cysteine desulfurase